ncbi:hypothetical protein QAD02_011319 [Eretmocerus hayati]|uniref:Uncharacterized protein n=1 Tax=Eretmocerus hayati TaxID=131215 RepID=A0ACC2NWE5_9HYME|nr:hypothetical protein QAD02_011319 [Eretmocerus hayati]
MLPSETIYASRSPRQPSHLTESSARLTHLRANLSLDASNSSGPLGWHATGRSMRHHHLLSHHADSSSSGARSARSPTTRLMRLHVRLSQADSHNDPKQTRPPILGWLQ